MSRGAVTIAARRGRRGAGGGGPPGSAVVARRSEPAFRFMGAWFERFFRRHMNGLRVARWGRPALPAGGGPLVIYSNHPAWWDAATCLLLARRLLPGFASFAPIEAAMLERYGFFGRLGGFGLDLSGPRGAAAFLRDGAEVLAAPGRALWVTAQGRFADPRERPLGLKPGVARLPELAPGATVLPLAIEYAFWTERGAEALVAFGPPLAAAELASLPRDARLARLEAELGATMDRLAHDAIARDPARFEPVLEGRPGIGGVYDGWRRLKAWSRGRAFDPAHGGGRPAGGGDPHPRAAP